ncbi:MAG: hypothetical protein U0169_18275 [Polyangiaceae bacterium]
MTHALTEAVRRRKNDVLYVLATVALACVRPWPRTWVVRAGAFLGAVAWVILPGARRTAFANHRRVFPDVPEAERRRFLRRVYTSLGRTLGETVALLGGPRGASAASPPRPRFPWAPGSAAILERARAKGRGVVFVSAHLGPWEHVASSLVAHGVPLTALARESYDPRFTRLTQDFRAALAVPVIHRGERFAAHRMLRVLRSGGVLGIPMDLRSRVPSVRVPFLGVEADTPVGPARLALRTGATIVVGTLAEDASGALVLEVTEVHGGAGKTPVRSDAAAIAVTAAINAELSRRILALPEQWVWMHPRFEGSPSTPGHESLHRPSFA